MIEVQKKNTSSRSQTKTADLVHPQREWIVEAACSWVALGFSRIVFLVKFQIASLFLAPSLHPHLQLSGHISYSKKPMCSIQVLRGGLLVPSWRCLPVPLQGKSNILDYLGLGILLLNLQKLILSNTWTEKHKMVSESLAFGVSEAWRDAENASLASPRNIHGTQSVKRDNPQTSFLITSLLCFIYLSYNDIRTFN